MEQKHLVAFALLAGLALLVGGCTQFQPVQNATGTASGARTVGYVGGSMTLGAVNGYDDLGGTAFWPDTETNSTYPGGSVYRWYSDLGSSGPRNRWIKFEEMLAKYPSTDKIWWNMLPKASPSDSTPTYEEALAVLQKIRNETGATVYISVEPKLPFGDQGEYDSLKGYADRMINDGLAERGPELAQLAQSQLGGDGHPNKDGQKAWGQDLADFFGK